MDRGALYGRVKPGGQKKKRHDHLCRLQSTARSLFGGLQVQPAPIRAPTRDGKTRQKGRRIAAEAVDQASLAA